MHHKVLLFLLLVLIVLPQALFSFESFRLYIRSFQPAGLSNPFTVSNMYEWYKQAVLSNNNFVLLNEPDNADFTVDARVDYDLERYTLRFSYTDSTGTNNLNDILYTTNLNNAESVQILFPYSLIRAYLLMKGQTIIPYQEGDGPGKWNTDNTVSKPQAVVRIRPGEWRWVHYIGVITLPLTYQSGNINNNNLLPQTSFIGYGFSFLQYQSLLFLTLTESGWGLGIGWGTDLINYQTTFDTNVFRYTSPGLIQVPIYAGGFIPLKVFIPFYMNPGILETDRQDFMISARYNWSIASYSQWDVSLRYIRSGLDLAIGWYGYQATVSADYSRRAYGGVFLEINLLFGQFIIPGTVLPGTD